MDVEVNKTDGTTFPSFTAIDSADPPAPSRLLLPPPQPPLSADRERQCNHLFRNETAADHGEADVTPDRPVVLTSGGGEAGGGQWCVDCPQPQPILLVVREILTNSGAHRNGSSQASELYKTRLRLVVEAFLRPVLVSASASGSGSSSGIMSALFAILKRNNWCVMQEEMWDANTRKTRDQSLRSPRSSCSSLQLHPNKICVPCLSDFVDL
ncbi:hypothetical protein O3P69_010515 [Scylla paramamosain]|uniref:Uncharacterized protein n=1 Tax=Scylla paramamosain TaxID=85552 RepID=A0AAW0TST7_SCYPA